MPRWLVALVAVLGVPVTARAEVRTVAIEDLAARSELIVIAKVTKIEDAPAEFERDDAGMPPLKVATAHVLEIWKGKPVREVRYIASPDWMCDTSHAEKGERVLLFLDYAHWRKDRSFLSISHAGRGRLPIREVQGKWYAALQDEVVLPPGTPTIPDRMTLRGSEQNQPTTVVTYSVTTIEVLRLRGLVKHTTRASDKRRL
jgi:hypothetical protein